MARTRYSKIYQKELARVTKLIDKYLSRGYAITTDIPSKVSTPTKADVTHLKSITESTIQVSAEHAETGQRYKSKHRKTAKPEKPEKPQPKKKPTRRQKTETQEEQITNVDIIIENFIRRTYDYFPNAEYKSRQWLNNALKTKGKIATADALQNVNWMTVHDSYEDDAVVEFIGELSDMLGLSQADQIEFLASFDEESGWDNY